MAKQAKRKKQKANGATWPGLKDKSPAIRAATKAVKEARETLSFPIFVEEAWQRLTRHSRSELNETADRYYDRKTYKGGNPAGGENTAW